jgi:hypothetical protein
MNGKNQSVCDVLLRGSVKTVGGNRGEIAGGVSFSLFDDTKIADYLSQSQVFF